MRYLLRIAAVRLVIANFFGSTTDCFAMTSFSLASCIAFCRFSISFADSTNATFNTFCCFNASKKWLVFLHYNYWGIMNVRGRPMFLDFVGHSLPRIYVPTNMFYFPFNLYKYYADRIIYQLTTKLRPYEPAKIWLPTNIGPHELKWFHSKIYHISPHFTFKIRMWISKFILCGLK